MAKDWMAAASYTTLIEYASAAICTLSWSSFIHTWNSGFFWPIIFFCIVDAKSIKQIFSSLQNTACCSDTGQSQLIPPLPIFPNLCCTQNNGQNPVDTLQSDKAPHWNM